MKIALRTASGWTKPIAYDDRNAKFVEGRAIFACPKCGAALFMAPHGGVYCDKVHDIKLCEDGKHYHKEGEDYPGCYLSL